MSVLATLAEPPSVILNLETCTPLYTGGVGQRGESLHPSGLLGSLRRFSGLSAAALGDSSFETRLWGTAPDAKDRHAKRVALALDLGELKAVTMPDKVTWPREDGRSRPGWYFSQAQVGRLRLTLTHRSPTDPRDRDRAASDWQLLLLALRIQIRHATLAARDQWGMGVVQAADLPAVEPLAAQGGAPSRHPGLQGAFFAQLQFDDGVPVDGGGAPDWRKCLEFGLRWRAHLRGALRMPGMDDLRHYLFGQLNQWGSAINVSALHRLPDGGSAVRVWGLVPHTAPARFEQARTDALKRLRDAMDTGPRGRPRRILWEDGAAHTGDLAAWINQLAGVA